METLENDGVAPLEIFVKRVGKRPLPISDRQEIDVSPRLNNELYSRYLQLIGIIFWEVELGCIDMFTKVRVLSQHQRISREGHLAVVYHILW